MRRVLLCFLLVLFSLSAFSADPEHLQFTAVIPEDYGVHKPSDAWSIDKFVFEKYDGTLITSENVRLEELSESLEEFELTMLYYGNLGYQYNIRVGIDPGNGWYMNQDGNKYLIPIDISYSEPDEITEGISVDEAAMNDSIGIQIEPVGPRRGEAVLDIGFAWEIGRDVLPGEYSADVKFSIFTE